MPSVKPKTKAQFNESKKHWPTAFHLNKELESKLNHSFFNESNLKLYSDLFLCAEKVDGKFISKF